MQTNKKSEGVIRKVAWGDVSNFFLVDKKMTWLYFPTCCISGADHMWPWPHALLFQEKCERYNQKAESKYTYFRGSVREHEFQPFNLDVLHLSKPLIKLTPFYLDRNLQSWKCWSDCRKLQGCYLVELEIVFIKLSSSNDFYFLHYWNSAPSSWSPFSTHY